MTDVRVDNPADFPPQEDTVERLWTPQRMTYVLRNSEIAQPSPRRRNARSASDPKIRRRRPHRLAWHARVRHHEPLPIQCRASHDLPVPSRRIHHRTRRCRTVRIREGHHPRHEGDGDRLPSGRIQHRHQSGARSRVPESPRTCTSMWCRVGMAMRTSCPSSPRRVPCRFCCPTSEMPMPRHSNSWPRSIICRLPDRVRHPRNRFYRYAQ